MKTEKEFESYFNSQIKPLLEDLERRRLEVINRYSFRFYKRGLLVLLGLFITVLIANAMFPGHGLEWGTMLAPLTGLFAIVVPIVIWVMRDKKNKPLIVEYRNIVKRKVVPFVNDQLKYDPSSNVSENDFKSSGLFAGYYDSFYSDDLVAGKLRGSDLRISNMKVGRNGKHTSIIFQGLFLTAELNRKISGYTMVQPDVGKAFLGQIAKAIGESKLNRFMNSLDTSMRSLNFSEVPTGDPDFENEFTVFSSEGPEAKSILSKPVMKKLTELNKRGLGHLHISFKDSRINLGISVVNPFEAAAYETFLETKASKVYLDTLTLAVEAMECFASEIPPPLPGQASSTQPTPRKASTRILNEVILKKAETPFILRLLWQLLNFGTIVGIMLMSGGWYGRTHADTNNLDFFTVLLGLGLFILLIVVASCIYNARKRLVLIELDGGNIKIKHKVFDRDDELVVATQRMELSVYSGRKYSHLSLNPIDIPGKLTRIIARDIHDLMDMATRLARPEVGLLVEARTQLLIKEYKGQKNIPAFVRYAFTYISVLAAIGFIGYKAYTNREPIRDYYYSILVPWMKSDASTDPSFGTFMYHFGISPPILDDERKKLIKNLITEWDPSYVPGKVLLQYNDRIVLSFQGSVFGNVAVAVMNLKTGKLISYTKVIEGEQTCELKLNGLTKDNTRLVEIDYACQENQKTINTKEFFQVSESGEVTKVAQR